MRREDWRDRDEARYGRPRRRDLDDYGQADYSDRYRYDPETRSGYRAYDDGREPYAGRERPYFGEAPPRRRSRHADDDRPQPRHEGRRRDGPSDRVLWAVITERLDAERRLDLSDVDVDVYDGEVTLNGFVKHKADKRRIEDVADIDGVRNVQNNLRVRARDRRWTFL